MISIYNIKLLNGDIKDSKPEDPYIVKGDT